MMPRNRACKSVYLKLKFEELSSCLKELVMRSMLQKFKKFDFLKTVSIFMGGFRRRRSQRVILFSSSIYFILFLFIFIFIFLLYSKHSGRCMSNPKARKHSASPLVPTFRLASVALCLSPIVFMSQYIF